MKTNRYGVKLDRYGYAPSLLPSGDSCWLCGMRDQKLDRHEVWYGPYRKKSKAFGLWVLLCHKRCHFGDIHKHIHEPELRRQAQIRAMLAYGWDTEDFIREFGKNYMEDEE